MHRFGAIKGNNLPNHQTCESWVFLYRKGGNMKKCGLCGSKITGTGHSSAPFNRKDCCDECNKNVVVLRQYLQGTQPNTLLAIEPNGVMIYVDTDEEKVTLEELQRLVGGYIELYPKDDDNFVFIVDEEGLLKDRQYNVLAKELFDIDVVGMLVLCHKNIFE